jgi:hypothetical protein
MELFVILVIFIISFIGTAWVVKQFYHECTDTHKNPEIMFIAGFFGWIPIMGLAFSITMFLSFLN